MSEVYLPSGRTSLSRSTGCGIKAAKKGTGTTIKNKKDAYQNGIKTQKDLLYLSSGTLLSESAPFSIPIRNAALNLDSDFEVLKFTPRSGALPRITDVESGYEFLPGRKPYEEEKDAGKVKKGKDGKEGDGGDDGEDDGGDDGGGNDGNNDGIKQENIKQETSLVPPSFHSTNPNISDGEYLAALASEDTYQNASERGQNRGLLEAGYGYENDMSTDEVAVYSNGSNMVVSLRGSQGFNDYVEDLGVITAGVTRTSRYQSDLASVQEIVQRYQAAGLDGQIIVAGHSLGGATAAAVTQRLIEDDPSLQSTLHGVTFNRLTGPLAGCRGPACDNITNLNAEGDVANTLDPDTTRVVQPTCNNQLRHSIGQFTQSNCSSEGTSKSTVLRGGEKIIGSVLDTAKGAVTSVARAVAGVSGVLGGAAGGYVSGGNPVAAEVGSAAGNYVGNKTVSAVGGLFRGSGQTDVTLEERISRRRSTGNFPSTQSGSTRRGSMGSSVQTIGNLREQTNSLDQLRNMMRDNTDPRRRSSNTLSISELSSPRSMTSSSTSSSFAGSPKTPSAASMSVDGSSFASRRRPAVPMSVDGPSFASRRRTAVPMSVDGSSFASRRRATVPMSVDGSSFAGSTKTPSATSMAVDGSSFAGSSTNVAESRKKLSQVKGRRNSTSSSSTPSSKTQRTPSLSGQSTSINGSSTPPEAPLPRRSPRVTEQPQYYHNVVYGPHGVRVQPEVNVMNNILRNSATPGSSTPPEAPLPRRGSRGREQPRYYHNIVYGPHGVPVQSTTENIETDEPARLEEEQAQSSTKPKRRSPRNKKKPSRYKPSKYGKYGRREN